MTKQLFLLAFCIFLGLGIQAQKVGTKHATYYYNRLPDNPLPKEFTTYSASFRTDQDLGDYGLTANKLIEEHFKLRGFTKLPRGGHFHINVNIGKYRSISVKNDKHETTTKDKEGNEKKVVQYSKTIVYRMPIRLTVEDMSGNVLMEELEGSPSDGITYVFRKGIQNYNSLSEMNKAWGNGVKVMTKVKKELIVNTLKAFSTTLKNAYATQNNKSFVTLMLAKGKKLANADEFEKQTLKAKEIIESIKANESIESQKEAMEPVLAFFETQKDNFSVSDKKEVKVHFACMFNIAAINYALENFVKANEYADEAVYLDVKKMNANNLSSTITKAMEKLERLGMTTRHFPIDAAAANPPEGADYSHLSEKPKVVIKDNSAKFPGYYITTSGDSLRGTYVITNGKHEEPAFHKNNVVYFAFEQGGEQIKWGLSGERFKKGGFNGRVFSASRFGSSVVDRKVSSLIEVVINGPKMKLYKTYPLNVEAGREAYPSMAIQKTGEKMINLDITNPRFIAWKKAFAKFFEDCEVLYAEIRVGEYKREIPEVMRAINVYNNNDCE